MAIVLMVLGFIWWWPLGLIILGFLIARRKYGYWRLPMYAGNEPMYYRDPGMDRWERKIARLQEKMEHVRGRMERFRGRGDWFGPSSSGNRAFDDYRAETLKRSKTSSASSRSSSSGCASPRTAASSISSWPRAASVRSSRVRQASRLRRSRATELLPTARRDRTGRPSPDGRPAAVRS
jgi:hypothetical protein